MTDLSKWRDPADLIDALFEARRGDRKDLTNEVAELLEHEESTVRQEALSLLCGKWRMQAFRPKALDMFQHDEDWGVRSQAALALASVSTPETRRVDASLLAATAVDKEGVSPYVRRACVDALTFMAGRPTYTELNEIEPAKVRALLEEITQLARGNH
jgi:HEAT repeat protein